jgi:hypothetical protein
MQYKINCGFNRPAVIIGRNLEKRKGQSEFAEDGIKMQYVNEAADVFFPNLSQSWGVRLDKEGKVPSKTLKPFDTTEYGGKIKFMKWGADGGVPITTRYLKGYDTLDYEYQKLALKTDELFQGNDDIAVIEMKTGENVITDEPVYILHLQNHRFNRDSKSRNPQDKINWVFHEINEEDEKARRTSFITTKGKAISIVSDVALGGEECLLNLFRAVQGIVYEEVNKGNAFEVLNKAADVYPAEFLAHVEDYRKTVSDTISKLDAAKMIDLTIKGNVSCKDKITDQAPRLILTGLPKKSEHELASYLVENCFAEKESNCILELIKISSNIK